MPAATSQYRVPSKLSRTSAGDLELIEEQGAPDRSDDELHARVLPFLYSSIDRRICKWEELRLNSFACNEDKHPVRHREGCDISAVELAAFRRAFTLDPLRWFSDFVMEEIHWVFAWCCISAPRKVGPDLEFV